MSVDDSLPITSGNNWSEVIGAIGGISTGKKWGSGSGVSFARVDGYDFKVDGLLFKPSLVFLSYKTTLTFPHRAFITSDSLKAGYKILRGLYLALMQGVNIYLF